MGNEEVVLDTEGFLVRPEQWTREVALILAKDAQLKEITPKHWEVMEAMRAFYFSRGKAPTGVELKETTGTSLLELKALFPGGIKFGARRIAGIPNPKGCS